MRRPRVEQGPVDGEVIAGQVAAQLALAHHRRQELIGDLMVEEAFTVLGESGGVEGGLVDAHVQEPLEQQVVVETFAERSLRADRVQRHQHRRLQQRLRGDAAPAPRRVHGVERGVQLGQDGVDHHPDPADRMIGRDQILRAQRRQHRQLGIRFATHPPIVFHPAAKREHPQPIFSTLRFSAPCEENQP
jgi:hypothetical protein